MNQLYEAEAAFLGCMILEPELIDEVYIQPIELYADERHSKMLEYILYTYEQDGTVDMTLIYARSGSKIDRIGGFEYLAKLVGAVPPTMNFAEYQAIIRNAYIQRESAKLLELTVSTLTNGVDVDVKQQIAKTQAQLEELAELAPKAKGAGLVHMSAVLEGHIEELTARSKKKGMTGPPTVSKEMDKLTGGHQTGDMEIVAARPSMGKTAYMNNDAIKVAESGGIAAIFSAEMSALSVAERVICSLGHLDGHKMRSGGFNDTDWERYSYARDKLDELKIHIDGTPGMNLQYIRSEVKGLVKKFPEKRIVAYIDYLQLIPAGIKFGTRREEVEYVSRSLKLMARQYGITVVALSQLSRSVEQRPDKRPMMSDIREAGGIEQDADIITFLYRDDYYNKDTEKKGIVELIVAKGRNIGTGTVEMVFLKQFSKFTDIDRQKEGGGFEQKKNPKR